MYLRRWFFSVSIFAGPETRVTHSPSLTGEAFRVHVDAAEEANSLGTLASGAIPWLTSLAINFLFIVGLALLAMPMLLPGGGAQLFVNFEPAGNLEQVESLDVATVSEVAYSGGAETMRARTEADLVIVPNETPAPEFAVTMEASTKSWSGLPSGQQLDMSTDVGAPPKPLSDRELKRAGSIEDAVDGIGGQIRQALGDNDLLVIWLLDASLSLVDDRQRVADRLQPIYEEIERQHQAAAKANRRAKLPILTNAVVAYGAGQAEIVNPTGLLGRAVEAIRKIPIDQTGLENVMSAVQRCVATYPTTVKRRTMIVIWTDESGDDIGMLEPTIELCRQADVKVSVVGPTAVLGAQEGKHVWIHESGQEFYLDVLKGPDTALPERLRWAYWWKTELPSWHSSGFATRNKLQGWYGGDQLAALASGFPPYALTRLAKETGGTMTVFDREIDRGPFSPEAMRDYAPDYRSAREILEELQYFPLRLALLKSADVTRGYAPMVPTAIVPSGYQLVAPPIMRRRLVRAEGDLREPVLVIEKALAPLRALRELESLYEGERSPRWKAWYDLTHGRLLAQSVRYNEARALFTLLAQSGALLDDVNCLTFSPDSHLISGEETEQRAKEAERLLTRCIEKNRNTPWAYLAQRELDHPLGIGYRAYYRKPPPPPSPVMFVPRAGGRPSAPIVPPRL